MCSVCGEFSRHTSSPACNLHPNGKVPPTHETEAMSINSKHLGKYEDSLRNLLDRLRGDTQALEEQTRVSTGGGEGGNLSSVPMHLGDLGTEAYLQELNSTLLENESQLRDEVLAALDRMERGEYGKCESCGRKIKEPRLEVLPYTRYCTTCAERLESDQIDFNTGRVEETGIESINLPDAEESEPAATEDNEREILFSDLPTQSNRNHPDTHAAGTPGGGSAVGGLGGTNIGGGDPEDVEMEDAMGSGNFDVELSTDDDEVTAYSGSAGGAVGGAPAGKRAVGGKRRPSAQK